MASAEEVTKRLFGGMVTTGGGDADAAGRAAQAHRRHRLPQRPLRHAEGRARRLRSPGDRQAPDLAAGVRDPPGPAAGHAQQPGRRLWPAAPRRPRCPTDETSVRTGADTQFLAPFFMQSIATAFNCGMTRVASVTFGYPGGGGAGGLRMPWLGFTDAQHSVSHHGNGAEKLRKYGLMNAWTHSQVKCCWTSWRPSPPRVARCWTRPPSTCSTATATATATPTSPCPTSSSAAPAAYFKTGQVLALPKTSPTKVLISIAHAMGVAVHDLRLGGVSSTPARWPASPSERRRGSQILISPRWTADQRRLGAVADLQLGEDRA